MGMPVRRAAADPLRESRRGLSACKASGVSRIHLECGERLPPGWTSAAASRSDFRRNWVISALTGPGFVYHGKIDFINPKSKEPAMPVCLNLTPETERILRERAAQTGQTLEA